MAEVGPGFSITSSRVNCQLNLALKYPFRGYQMGFIGISVYGRVELQDGVKGGRKLTTYFSGQVAQVSSLILSSFSSNLVNTKLRFFYFFVWTEDKATS